MPLPLIGLDPLFADHAEAVRKAYGRLTPFRLGLEVGRHGRWLACPYEPRTKSARLYEEGFEAGLGAIPPESAGGPIRAIGSMPRKDR